MRVNTIKYNTILITIVIVLTFIGYYLFNIIALNFGLKGNTRIISIPVRLFIGVCCAFIFFKNYKMKNSFIVLFLLFFLAYTFRILIDMIKSEFFYIPYFDLIFYFISFCVIPSIAMSKLDFKKINVDVIFRYFLISSFIFVLMTTLLYSKYIGEVGRLTSGATTDDVINPLVISYCSTLIIGVILFYLMYNKASGTIKVLSFITIVFSTIPFFLGSSRGSIFALFFPFIILMVSSISLKNLFKIIIVAGFSFLLLAYLDNYFNSGLLDRFTNTTDAIEQGGESAIRLLMWKISFGQFLNSPIVGDKLNTDIINEYPHNIYLEALQATGILGFIPLLILILFALKNSMYIFKKQPKYAWISVFFLQALMQNMFTSSLYMASWFWLSLPIVLSLTIYLKSFKPIICNQLEIDRNSYVL